MLAKFLPAALVPVRLQDPFPGLQNTDLLVLTDEGVTVGNGSPHEGLPCGSRRAKLLISFFFVSVCAFVNRLDQVLHNL